MKSKILVCGSRYFNQYSRLKYDLRRVLNHFNLDADNVEIVSGHCYGADYLGERFAREHNIKTKLFKAEWDKYGLSAGPIRNNQMINYIKDSDQPIVIAFLTPTSRGTRNTIDLARANKIQTFVINV